MPLQTTPDTTPESVNPLVNTPEVAPEGQIAQPEIAPLPITPEAPQAEVLVDQPSVMAPQTPPLPVAVEPVQTVPETTEVIAEEEQEEVDKPGEINDAWVHAATAVIEKDKDKPYEEEEDAEKLNVDYQQKAFGKEIKPKSE
jgi:hypothetical protein